MIVSKKSIRFIWMLSFFLIDSSFAVNIPDVPLGISITAKPMTLIVAGRDHKLFYEAYNDASDVDGDGSLDIRFKPSITYYGLFDSSLCYSYASNLFRPDSVASNGKCPGTWSGNWLNYVTTSRIDALRKVLYGGYREVDTASKTILRRAYIPQDAHSWSKEYTSESVDGYKISDYTPFSQPNSGKRHFFGNLTKNASTNCGTLSNCSDKKPLLSVVLNTSKRVWEWASKESPVLDSSHGGSRTNYTVRVKVCTTNFHNGCKQYAAGNYKPVGVLHDYGENDAMLFGLLTGSYNKNTSGGVLRKVISSFKDEVDENTGVFTANDTIVSSFDSLRIRDFNNGSASRSYRPFWSGAWVTTRPMFEGEFVDWGNPVGEMMYEGLRYFAGKSSPTSDFFTSGSYDAEVGLSAATWDNPYDTNSSVAKAESCAKPNMMVVSDINPSYDSDQVPGSYFNTGFSSDISDLDVESELTTISTEENVAGLHFIGQSESVYDGAPTAKTVSSIGKIRGLAPEEPTKEGSYYSAAIAYYAKTHDVNTADDDQTIDSFYVALASPLPQFKLDLNGQTVTLVPFAKSVGGCLGISPTNFFQPTNQIVDFYVDTLANMPGAPFDSGINGGRPYIKFRINFEDVEQAADHDMDAIAVYEISVTSSGTLQVDVAATYASGCIIQHLGYIVSGTTADGVYLVVRDSDTSSGGDVDYALDTPNVAGALPLNSSRFFTPGGTAATLLHDPLWYAAKWGGFIDKNGNNKPDLQYEWDADSNGVPDTYFLVQNPLKLKQALKRAFDNIIERSASAGNVTANSTSISTDTLVFQSIFNTATWSGDVLAYSVTSAGVSSTANWKVSEHIPSHDVNNTDHRNIFTKSGGSAIEFIWTNLSSTDQANLVSEDVVNFLRGDRSNELQNGGQLRNRSVNNILGDIIHSSPLYVDDSETLYVGANDGMLHAFDATTAKELFAFIPSKFLNQLAVLSEPGYTHKYFADGDATVSTDALTPGKNYLVATLGAGGKGLFALDVTSPSSFGTGDILWEYYDTSDNQLGYMLGKPVIAKMNDGSTVAILGNGYNSSSGNAVLFIFNLTTGTVLKKIDTGAGGDNGLASPGVYDEDEDGDIDVIYAGDLYGNVWKFDVSDSDPDNWDVAFKTGTTAEPFFTAKNSSNQAQPITAQINIAKNEQASDSNFGKIFIFFGTGSYFQAGDPHNTEIQSWYGLIDEGTQITSRTDLVQRSVLNEGTLDGKIVRTFSEASSNDMNGMSGWYIDFDTQSGERIVTSSKVYKLFKSVLIASSIIPVVDDPCIPGGKGFLNIIDPFTGARIGTGIIDVNENDDFTDDKLDSVFVGGIDLGVAMPSEAVLIKDRLVVGGTSGNIGSVKVKLGLSPDGKRLSWRELYQQ